MDLYFLPSKYTLALQHCNINSIYEIRMRVGYCTKIITDSSICYISESGFTLLKENALICTQDDIAQVVSNVTERSLYAHNDKIKFGFIVTRDGVRIGLAGECVNEEGRILTIKNFSSINIRIPHDIDGCSDVLYNYVQNKNNLYNTLIISPPIYGKTTLLKDLAKNINNKHTFPILIIDERGEFASVKGENIDIIKFSDKLYAFNCGIRALAPSLVITDELNNNSDWLCVKKASISGVKIIASCHGESLIDVLNNENFIKGVFERYVVLKNVGQPGIIDKVFDRNYNVI